MSSVELAAVESVDSFEPLRTIWDGLADATPTCHPQYLLSWKQTWWHHRGSRHATLRCLCVKDRSGDTLAIAPLALRVRRSRAMVSIRELRWLDDEASDQNDILTCGDAVAAGRAIGTLLRDQRRDWDELHLMCVPAASEAIQGLLSAFVGREEYVALERRTPSFFIDTVSVDWRAYLATTSKKFVRRDLPRIERRLAEIGPMTIEANRTPDIVELLAELGAIHGARQRELGRPSRYAEASYLAFVGDALQAFTEAGLVTVWTLRIGSRLAAYLIGFEDRGVFYAWNMAHDPAYGGASPGKVLWARAIRGCFEDPRIREFSMMRGDTAYKLKWAPQSRDLLDVRVRNLATARSALVNKLRRTPS